MSTTTEDAPMDPPAEVPAKRRLRFSTVLAALVAAAMLAMWAWVLVYHLSGAWRQETPGRLEDPAFGASAELVCASARDSLAVLPAAHTTPTPEGRAEVVEEANALLATMVLELRTLPTGTPGDTERINEWLDDWSTYIADRESYVERLRSDSDTRLYVTQSDRDRRQVTQALDRFANTNQMSSCTVPLDVT